MVPNILIKNVKFVMQIMAWIMDNFSNWDFLAIQIPD